MTSTAKAEANRLNAKKSTGPRTAAGRARASQNASRHKLSSAKRRPVNEERIVSLAEQILRELGASTISDCRRLALRFTAAALDLKEVRRIRIMRLAEARNEIAAGDALGFAKIPDLLDSVCRLNRYESRAFSRLRLAAQKLA
jgi:hypothetical protein